MDGLLKDDGDLPEMFLKKKDEITNTIKMNYQLKDSQLKTLTTIKRIIDTKEAETNLQEQAKNFIKDNTDIVQDGDLAKMRRQTLLEKVRQKLRSKITGNGEVSQAQIVEGEMFETRQSR